MGKPVGKLLRLRASRLDKEDSGLFCLPLGFRDILLDVSERLEWSKTWIDGSGETAVLTEEQIQTIELGIMRLSDMCEIVINNVVESPDVNVNCGGGGDVTIINPPNPVRVDGDPIDPVSIPLDTGDPFAENVPVWDEETMTPPDGFVDWSQFEDAKCEGINYMIDLWLDFGLRLDSAENTASLIMEIVILVAQTIKPLLKDTKGWGFIIDAIRALLAALDAGEEALDWLQAFNDTVLDNRDDITCILYKAPDVYAAVAEVIVVTREYFIAALLASHLTTDDLNIWRNFWDTVVNGIVPLAYHPRVLLNIPEEYTPPVSCETCSEEVIALGGGFWAQEIKLEFDSYNAGSGVTGENHTELLSGAFRYGGVANAPGRNLMVQLRVPEMDMLDNTMIGFMVEKTYIRNNESSRLKDGSDVYRDLWDGSNRNDEPLTRRYYLRGGANRKDAFIAGNPGADVDTSTVNVPMAYGLQPESSIGLGMVSTTDGDVSCVFRMYYILHEGDLT